MPKLKAYKRIYKGTIVYPGLEKYIQDHEMTLKAFSESIGISYSHTACILHGLREPYMSSIRKILKTTGLTFDEAFGVDIGSIKPRSHVWCYREAKGKKRHWKIYWPAIEKLARERDLRWEDISRLANIPDPKNAPKMLVSKDGREPNMSMYYIKKLIEGTGEPFETLFALPEE